ncbi:hypothetical protein ACWKSP_26575 [Micromonosporaceae bacterium Da 78-11]
MSVEIIGEAKGLAKSIRKEFESAFKGLDVGRLVREAVGNTRIRIPVTPDFDASSIAESVRRTRVPKVPVDVDPERIGASIRAATARIRATVKVEPKLSGTGSGSAFTGLSGLFKGLIPDIGGVGSAIRGLSGGVQQFAGVAAQGGSQLAGSIAQAAGPIGTVISLLASAATAMGALGAAAVFVVPAMTAVAGAAAAIPAALSGLGAVFGTLSLGFKGISDAFKPKAGGGGGGAGGNAAGQARQVASAGRAVEAARRGITAANRSLEASERSLAAAQRGVAAAQRAVLSAQRGVVEAELSHSDALQRVVDTQKRATLSQQAVNRARVDATEDIDDLNRSLRGAVLSEEEATLGITEALRALESARLTGNIPDIQKADLAYRQSLQTLDEARDTTDDLQRSTGKANKLGVEGSEKVQSALSDQADAYKDVTAAQRGVADAAQGIVDAQQGVLDAQNGVIDATDSLKSAQDGVLSAQDGIKAATDGLISAQDSLAQSQQKVASGAGGVAKQVTKLAPAAQKFVDAIKALKPAFEDLRLDVQQRLFEGLDKTVTNLGQAWIPALKTTLGSYATTFNTFFKDLGTSVTTPKFISDLQAGAEGFRQLIADVGQSITSSLVPAFGALSRAAGPFLATLGKELAGIVTQFSNWVLQGERSGALTSFFDRAAKAMSSLFTTGRLVGAIIADLFQIITGAQAKSGATPIDSFNNALKKVDEYLSDPKHQQQIRDFVTDLAEGLRNFGQTAAQVNGFLDRIGGEGSAKGSSVGSDIGQALVSGLLAGVGEGLKQSLESFVTCFTPFGPFVQPIKDALGVKSPSTVFAEIGRNLVLGLIQGIGERFPELGSRAQQIRTQVTTALGDAGSWLYTHGQNAVNGLGNGIVSLFGSLRSRALGLRTTVSNALSDAGTWLITHGRNVVTGLGNGIAGFFGNLRTRALGLKTTITNSLSDAGSFLYNYGYNTVIGFYNGLVSLGGFLYNNVSAFIKNNVANAMRSALGINSPSRVAMAMGRFVPQGLAIGMESETGRVQAAADALAAAALPSLGDPLGSLGADFDAQIQRSLTVASKADQPVLRWAAGSTGDTLLDALREKIEIGHRGDVVAALGS